MPGKEANTEVNGEQNTAKRKQVKKTQFALRFVLPKAAQPPFAFPSTERRKTCRKRL